ncbi:hypothetical protein COCNU_06G003280 [Cocos nucifera]|uniref:Uncharacterized protein n=1 Tax=Cocos nucifera TaxID=13894 RepID=A0A8K0IA92_COCNU|nr:hypothetical protein COCNU_06G003270 [Cocos nucifera]KAG1346499.1 hypothetical protein COCNU_06G003280 [Cocos nucifera]
MDFSDRWQSFGPIAAVFAAPTLLSGASSKPFGPLLFFPSSPPILLLSSRSLALQIPPPLPPSTLLDGVRAFFCRTSTAGLLPSAAQDSLVADLLSSPSGGGGDPISSNSLHALRCRDGSSMVLFFPTGENADLIGYVGLSFKGPTPEIRVDRDGDVFRQKEGFKHPCHRILKISVTAAPSSSWSPATNSVSVGKPRIEGFLIATTLYSVNWFRVETRALDSGGERPFLVPLAKQGFKSSVVHACWSPHIPEESVALLESGDLCCFNLNSKHGRVVRVTLGGDDPGKWLSSEYGGQPEILIVACSIAVVMVDLRSKKDSKHKVLVRIDMLGSYHVAPLLEKIDRILAFCRAGFNGFHMSIVTERQLFLFDARQPLFPILTWDHSLERPSYVAMFKLSELRPSEDEYKWASDSGYVILAGSLWSNEFSLFCYGPKEKGTLSNFSLYAWDLPSYFSLSARPFTSGDSIVKEIFYKENVSKSSEWRQRKNVVVGFYIVPSDLLNINPKSAGFSLIRLTLSGRLEIQRYHSLFNLSDESYIKEEESLKPKNSFIYWKSEDDRVFNRYSFFRLCYLYDNMNSNLFNALAMQNSLLNHKETNQVSLSHDMEELISKILKFSNVSISDFVSDASIPTNVFEIASRRVLSCIPADYLPLVFKRYSDLFENQRESSFELLEVPSCLPHNRLLPFFVGEPSIRSEKWSRKASPGVVLVGPVLPLSVLLALQQIDRKINDPSDAIDEKDDDLLNLQCRLVLEHVCPEMFIVDISNCNGWGASQEQEKPFFVYEPAEVGNKSTCNGGTGGTATLAIKEELAQMGHMMRNCKLPYKVDKFDTFICGIAEKKCNPDSEHGSSGPEMFDQSPIRLDFDPCNMVFQSAEQKLYKCLKRQDSKWKENYKPYQDFCFSSKIPKLAQ